jgi:hypothetical protein
MTRARLGVGFVGSGFNTRFHLQAWRGVRDADVLGIWSPNAKHAADAAVFAKTLDVGPARPYTTIADMVADPAIDAIWLCGPNHARSERRDCRHDRARRALRGLACEKSLAQRCRSPRPVARRPVGRRASRESASLHMWRGHAPRPAAPRPYAYLARAARSCGPHAVVLAGPPAGSAGATTRCAIRHGGALSADETGDPPTVKPVRVTGHPSLKWSPACVAPRQMMGSRLSKALSRTPRRVSRRRTGFRRSAGVHLLGYVGAGLRRLPVARASTPCGELPRQRTPAVLLPEVKRDGDLSGKMPWASCRRARGYPLGYRGRPPLRACRHGEAGDFR